MAYNGYLVKVGGANGTILPMRYIKLEGYKISPNQRMEVEAKRDVEGYLHRKTVTHTSTKIEFETPIMTNRDFSGLVQLLRSHYTVPTERKLTIQYYDTDTDSYKTAECYVPDYTPEINRIENNIIYYNSVRFAFIEY